MSRNDIDFGFLPKGRELLGSRVLAQMRHYLYFAMVNVLQTAVSERRSLGAYDAVKTITVQVGDQLTYDQVRNGPLPLLQICRSRLERNDPLALQIL